MTELLGVVGFVVLFVISGFLSGRIQRAHGCGCTSCKGDPASCNTCHLTRDISE